MPYCRLVRSTPLNMKKKKTHFLRCCKKLEIVSERKGIIPYELIIGMKSFFLTSEKDFWEKTEFFSDLKQSAVNDDDHENSK